MIKYLLVAAASGIAGILLGVIGLAVVQQRQRIRRAASAEDPRLPRQENLPGYLWASKSLQLYEREERRESESLSTYSDSSAVLAEPLTAFASSIPSGPYKGTVHKSFRDEGYLHLHDTGVTLRVSDPGRFWPEGSKVLVNVLAYKGGPDDCE